MEDVKQTAAVEEKKVNVTESDTEKWKGIGILRIGGKSNGRI